MLEDLRQYGDKLVEIAERHRFYVLRDSKLNLTTRTERKREVRSFYGNIFNTLGLLTAVEEWYHLDTVESPDKVAEEYGGNTYSLQELMRVVGVRDNTLVFKILDDFRADLRQHTLNGATTFTVETDVVKRIVESLHGERTMKYGRLRRQKNG